MWAHVDSSLTVRGSLLTVRVGICNVGGYSTEIRCEGVRGPLTLGQRSGAYNTELRGGWHTI